MQHPSELKLTVIGEACAGKTILFNFLLNKSYRPNPDVYQATIGADFRSMTQGSHKINMWDTAGQERFCALARTYIRGAAVVMICVDVSPNSDFNPQSLDQFTGMVQPGQPIVIVGTKQREGEKTSFQQQLEAWCVERDYPFLSVNPTSTSASEQRQALLSKVVELASEQKEQAAQQRKQTLSRSGPSPTTSLGVAIRHFQALLAGNPKYADYQGQLNEALSGNIQAFQYAYLKNSGYSVATRWIIAHHCINVCSKLALLSLAVASGFAFAQISPLVGLVVAASSLLIAVVVEQAMAAKRGHLFGFFSPLDSAAAAVLHESYIASNQI